MSKVLVGMSGGVDSSVAAYILKEKRYEVEGLSLILWESKSRGDFTTCCSLQATEEASKTASHIGIPHSSIDVRDDFIEKVIEPFIDAYTMGSTPNPCILCNRFIKFPFLMKEAKKRGAEYIATGHYARTKKSHQSSVISYQLNKERGFLKKGIDLQKDQSYFLYVLGQEELNRLILPLGYYRKDDVRRIAQELNLSAAKRPESQEICFIENRNYFKFIEKLSPVAQRPGPIVDMNGNVIGTHKGIYGYTIGQRKGLGISSPEPLYVVKIDAVKNTICVGPQDAAKKKDLFVEDLNWIVPPSSEQFRATVKVRSMMKDKPATITYHASRRVIHLTFDKPQWAPASGQSAVFYDGDFVMGGGTIKTQA